MGKEGKTQSLRKVQKILQRKSISVLCKDPWGTVTIYKPKYSLCNQGGVVYSNLTPVEAVFIKVILPWD